jgi:hypothetical protein
MFSTRLKLGLQGTRFAASITPIYTHKLDPTVLINEQDVKLAILPIEEYHSVALRLVNKQKVRLVQ